MNIFIRIVSCATNQGVWYVFFFVIFCMPKKGRKKAPAANDGRAAGIALIKLLHYCNLNFSNKGSENIIAINHTSL